MLATKGDLGDDAERTRADDPRLQEAINELQGLIKSRYPRRRRHG